MVQLKKKGSISFIEWSESTVPVLSDKSLLDFSKILDRLGSSTKVCIIISKHPSIFIAGADLKEIQTLQTKKDFSDRITKVHQMFRKMEENSKISFISAIHGACLGGGTELTLACDYRVATLNPKTKIGLPEVQLGLIPGFGGCARLPKMVGLGKALDIIISGKSLSAPKAHRMGLVDEVEGIDHQLENRAVQIAQKIIDGKLPIKPQKFKSKFNLLEMFPIKNVVLFYIKKQILKKTKGFYPAPLEALRLIRKIDGWPLSQALEEEKNVFSDLAVTSISQNLIHLFFLTEDGKKKSLNHLSQKKFPIKNVAVLGAGVMGSGIAYVSICKNFKTRLRDIHEKSLIKGRGHIHSLLKKQIKRKKMSSFEERTKKALVSYSMDFDYFSTSDLVIEAIVEDMSIKKKTIQEASSYLKDSCIFATNTSSLSVSEMAKVYKDPSRFVGLHFFNPVHRLPLVEVIRGEQTSDETVVAVFEFVKKLSKTPILVKDGPGFLVNRLLMPWLAEALWSLEEGLSIRQIDRAFSKEFGWPMGPFRLMDEVGMDVCVEVIKNLKQAGLKISAPKFIDQLGVEGCLGKKTLMGFYHYTEEGVARSVNQEFENKFRHYKKSLNPDEMVRRGMYQMINEASLVLEEKIVESAKEVDLGMILGAGFPPFRGGLLKYADQTGIQKIVKDLQKWSDQGLQRFKVSSFLKNLSENKSYFYQE